MVDFLTKKERSKRMAAVRQKNTPPELALRRVLHHSGLRFRLHVTDLPGKPDIVLPKFRSIIFVHGCFWHRHSGCRLATTPMANKEFWIKKFNDNVLRDTRTIDKLKELGWHVFVVWQCEVSTPEKAELTGSKLAQQIRNQSASTNANHS